MRVGKLVYGMKVAVRIYPSHVHCAYVLDTRTKWRKANSFGANNSGIPDNRKVAVAWSPASEMWLPAVVDASQIISTWDEYCAKEQAADDKRIERSIKVDKRREDRFNAERAACATLSQQLGIKIGYLGKGKAVVSIAQVIEMAKQMGFRLDSPIRRPGTVKVGDRLGLGCWEQYSSYNFGPEPVRGTQVVVKSIGHSDQMEVAFDDENVELEVEIESTKQVIVWPLWACYRMS